MQDPTKRSRRQVGAQGGWAAGLALLLLACAGPPAPEEAAIEPGQQALSYQIYESPFGPDTPVRMYAGERTDVCGQWVVYQRKSDNVCLWHKVGPCSGLQGGVHIYLSHGDDYGNIVDKDHPVSVGCWQPFGGYYSYFTFVGFEQDGQSVSVTGGPPNLDGRGHDILICGGRSGDVWCVGGEGDDLLMNYNPRGQLWGGPGNDRLESYAPQLDPTIGLLSGGAGDDCLSSASDLSRYLYDCGPGSNDSSTRFMGYDCERVVSSCGY